MAGNWWLPVVSVILKVHLGGAGAGVGAGAVAVAGAGAGAEV